MDETKTTKQLTSYTEDYKESAFWTWYRGGKPAMSTLASMVESTPDGDRAASSVLSNWSKVYQWESRAQVMDLQVRSQIERIAVREKVEMYQRQADVGKKLIVKAMEYMENENWDLRTPANALAAIKYGSELERKTRGVSDAIAKLSELDSDKLDETIVSLLNAARPEDLQEMLIKLQDPEIMEAEYSESMLTITDNPGEEIRD